MPLCVEVRNLDPSGAQQRAAEERRNDRASPWSVRRLAPAVKKSFPSCLSSRRPSSRATSGLPIARTRTVPDFSRLEARSAGRFRRHLHHFDVLQLHRRDFSPPCKNSARSRRGSISVIGARGQAIATGMPGSPAPLPRIDDRGPKSVRRQAAQDYPENDALRASRCLGADPMRFVRAFASKQQLAEDQVSRSVIRGVQQMRARPGRF